MWLVLFLAFAADAEKDVRAFVVEFADTWIHADRPEDVAACYAVDATHVNPQGKWVRSRAELVPYFEPLVFGRSDSFDAAFGIEAVHFVTDDVALVDGTIVIRGMRGRDGVIIPRLLERFAFVLKKNGGRWEITASRVMFPAG